MSAILSTNIHTFGSSQTLEKYLEDNNRSLCQDASPFLRDPKNWGKEFDQDRCACNKDGGRKLYHFVISPNPEDNCTLEQLRAVSQTWVNQKFGDCKYVIDYHDDNGILHAHIAVNAIRLNGYKIQIDPEEWADLPNSCHRIAREYGLRSALNDVLSPRKRAKEKKYTSSCRKAFHTQSFAENAMHKRGVVTWKDEIRNLLDKNKKFAPDWLTFKKMMLIEGIEVRETRQGVTFNNLNAGEKGWNFACKDCKLGTKREPFRYTREEISKYFIFDAGNLKNQSFKIPETKYPTMNYSQLKRLKKSISQPEVHTFHGRLTRYSQLQLQERTQLLLKALDIAKNSKVNSFAEMETNIKTLESDRNELQNELDLLNNQRDALKNIVYYLDVFDNKDKIYSLSDQTTANLWLEQHNVDSFEAPIYRENLAMLNRTKNDFDEAIQGLYTEQQYQEIALETLKGIIVPTKTNEIRTRNSNTPRTERQSSKANSTTLFEALQYLKTQQVEVNSPIAAEFLRRQEQLRVNSTKLDQKPPELQKENKVQKTLQQSSMRERKAI